MENFQLAPGFFHVQLNQIWAILHVHQGSIEESGGLQYYISLLGRVRLGTEYPDYHTLVSFATQVLVRHITLYWETICGMSLSSLAEARHSPEEMKAFAMEIYHKYILSHALDQITGQSVDSQDSVL
ncbi:uncharacterized protein F5891DRAFT_955742 [Suillus fuscotomentosus]|uniref:DUF6589 domain-containing protein n=1 Tax=Suillus fuscotomentosus TaxID=1912939 RepID=A0AAD4E4R6_9AGAM|nr:uncharacterized protein F5891DRAFT_955742 [Suillus fuscotomentosus]KAG1898293.1 hypothetical protein F5891DRAFT_955742 [Suillus fuscotomentosus]